MWTAKNVSLIVSLLSFVGGSAAALNGILTGIPNEALYVQIATGIAGYIGTALGLVLAWMTRQDAQVANIAARIDEPGVKAQIIPAVASLAGVKGIAIDLAKADATVKSLADSTAPENSKIEAAK
jgi:hypothetical protein